MNEMQQIETKSLFATIVGRPNVGKSTLINALVGEKVAITSGKPQTTRTRITGVVTKGAVQYVLMDTPGLHIARTKLGEHMVQSVKDAVADMDLGILVTDPFGTIRDAEKELVKSFQSRKMRAILVINKTDLCSDKKEIADKIVEMTKYFDFEQVIPLSAATGDGLDRLMSVLETYAVPSVHFFPDDAMTDQTERVIASEIIREKLLQMLYDELPHGTAVAIDRMKERADGKILDIDATIFCERKSHKGMIIGKQGSMLKKIASAARMDLEDFFHTKVNLQCWVKVKDDWRNSEFLIKDLGLS